jgi:subfamily B ATP-binding cassette protein MsbA
MSTQVTVESAPKPSAVPPEKGMLIPDPPVVSSAPLTQQRIYRVLLGYLRRHLVLLAGGLLCGILVGVANAYFINQIKLFVNSLVNPNPPALMLACLLVVVLYGVMGALKYGQSVLLATVAQQVGLDMRRDVYAHLQSLSLSYFNRRRTGALMSTLTNDIPKLQDAAMMLKDVVATPVQALIYLGFMFKISWQLTCFSLAVVPVMAVIIQSLTKRLRGISLQTQERMADAASVMEEALAAPRIVRAFSAEAYEIERFERESKRVVDSKLRAIRRSARLGPIVDLLGAIGVAAALYYGGTLVINKKMETGELFAFLLLVSQVANSVNAIGSLKSGWEEMMGAADRIFSDVLDMTPEIKNAPNAKELPPINGRVEFRSVSFAYEPGQPVLSDINLIIEPGQMVAFVGETGAGKTTLADLIPRFYDPVSGVILIDGCDIRTVTIESLRRQIGIVPQETLLLSGSIRDNIAYGKRDASYAEVEAAARAANAAGFIEATPDGYETWVGERGTTLSGGQRQRIAIARALLANPRILILDEATSALDAATEAMVQDALETLMRERTTFVIAHRLSTIVQADKIVVLKRGGRIAEVGTHAELLAIGGVYAALYESQRRASTETLVLSPA